MSHEIFLDRRREDRRQPAATTPQSGCRRAGERRRKQGRYSTAPWWLQIDYAEELTPRAATTELRRVARRQQKEAVYDPPAPAGLRHAKKPPTSS